MLPRVEGVCLLSKCETHTPARKRGREKERGESGCESQLEMETSLDFLLGFHALVSRLNFYSAVLPANKFKLK